MSVINAIKRTLSTRFGSNVNRKVALQKGNLRVGYTGSKFIVNCMFWGETGRDAASTRVSKITTGAFSSLCGRKVTKHTVVASADYRRILHTDLIDAVSGGRNQIYRHTGQDAFHHFWGAKTLVKKHAEAWRIYLLMSSYIFIPSPFSVSRVHIGYLTGCFFPRKHETTSSNEYSLFLL